MNRLARRIGRLGAVIAAVVLTVAVNLVVYGVGAALGATYRFTAATGPAHVDALTLSGFTAVPLLVGLAVVAVLSRWWGWVPPVALAVAVLGAIGSIPFMPFSVDLDLASAIALAIAHVVVATGATAGILAIRSLGRRPATRAVTA